MDSGGRRNHLRENSLCASDGHQHAGPAPGSRSLQRDWALIRDSAVLHLDVLDNAANLWPSRAQIALRGRVDGTVDPARDVARIHP